jgi:deoxyribonuclease-4
LRCTALQIFTRSPARWAAPVLSEKEAGQFRSLVERQQIRIVLAHAPYLINLASSDVVLRARSIATMVDDLERCARLGIRYLIVHPGSHGGAGKETGLRNVAGALQEIFGRFGRRDVGVLLENTAGQGRQLGSRMKDLIRVGELAAPGSQEIGICLDVCHAFAAGYDVRSVDAYESLLREGRAVERIRAIHLNDSRGDFGSHRDRHEHIGEGGIGAAFFQRILQDVRFQDVPKIIETPKMKDGKPWDAVNLRRLRRLAACRPSRSARSGDP